MQLWEEEEKDLVEGQGVRKRRRLAAAAPVVWVHVCDEFVCRCFYAQRRQIKPVCYTGL